MSSKTVKSYIEDLLDVVDQEVGTDPTFPFPESVPDGDVINMTVRQAVVIIMTSCGTNCDDQAVIEPRSEALQTIHNRILHAIEMLMGWSYSEASSYTERLAKAYNSVQMTISASLTPGSSPPGRDQPQST